MEYLPSIISAVGVILTVAVSFWLGLAKQRTDNTTAKNTIEGEFREDLFALVERDDRQLVQKEEQIRARDDRIEKRETQLQTAQAIIAAQLEKITDLNLALKQLQHDKQYLTEELDKFNRKVYYTSENKNELDTK